MNSVTAGLLSLTVLTDGVLLIDNGSGQTLLRSSHGCPLLPVIDGTTPELRLEDLRSCDDGIVATFHCTTPGPLRTLRLFIVAAGDAIDLSCEFTTATDCQLNALHLMPSGTGINLYDAVNFRNRHFTDATWPELHLGSRCETTTYSDDWQFAPHPSALIFRKNETSLFAGFIDLQATFGLRLKVWQHVIKQWDVNFGDKPHGIPLSAGKVFHSGRLRFFLRRDLSVHALFTEFGTMLVAANRIPSPALKPSAAWWHEPIYCTWGDQWMQANRAPAVSLADQTAEDASPATDVLDETFVWRAVETIRRERLPVRTIILDEGWAVARGDWRPHPGRFPDLRGLVDRLHALGFKVLVWWNWAEIAREAEVDESHLVNHGRWLNKHGCRWRDYSDPLVQEGYLSPLLRTLFGTDPGCFDLDGVKTDFLADKVHPETPVHDLAWRGEERYFINITRLFYEQMRYYKPDAMHLGCAGHYWLAEWIDLNRTYDVHSSNWREHEERARMLMCTCRGATPSYDMMTCTENTDRWFASARRLGAVVQIGNVLHQRPDLFTPVRPADKAYWNLLRAGLE